MLATKNKRYNIKIDVHRNKCNQINQHRKQNSSINNGEPINLVSGGFEPYPMESANSIIRNMCHTLKIRYDLADYGGATDYGSATKHAFIYRDSPWVFGLVWVCKHGISTFDQGQRNNRPHVGYVKQQNLDRLDWLLWYQLTTIFPNYAYTVFST